MLNRRSGVVEVTEREIARKPLKIGKVATLGEPVRRGELVGRFGLAPPHCPTGQKPPKVGPVLGLAQIFNCTVAGQRNFDGAVIPALPRTPVETLEGEARIISQRRRHLGDKVIHTGFRLAKRNPRLRQRLPVLGDPRHKTLCSLCPTAPKEHVEPCFVVRFQKAPVALEKVALIPGGQRKLPPRADDEIPRDVLVAPGLMRCGEHHKAGPGLGRDFREVPDHLVGTRAIGHLPFGFPAQIGNSGPVPPAFQEGSDLVEASAPRAMPMPVDDVAGHRSGAARLGTGLVPVAVTHRLHRIREPRCLLGRRRLAQRDKRQRSGQKDHGQGRADGTRYKRHEQ